MWLHSLWEEPKGLVSRQLPLQWILQDLAAGKLISRIGEHQIQAYLSKGGKRKKSKEDIVLASLFHRAKNMIIMLLGYIVILFCATLCTLNRKTLRLQNIKRKLFYYFQKGLNFFHGLICRFTLPPFLTLKNFEGLDLGKMDEVSDNWDCTTLSLSLLWLQSRMNLQHPLHYGYALPPG